MYIIYNRDGSIKRVKLTDFINKGSDGVNTINVAIDDFDLTGVTAHVQWTLPNGETVGPLILQSGEPFDDDVGDHYENCFVVSIDEPETLFEGLLKGSLVLIDAQTRILYTYPIKLVINPSTFVPSSSTNITTEQYAALVEYIETNYVKSYSQEQIDALLSEKATYDFVNSKTQKIGAFMGNARGFNKLYYENGTAPFTPPQSDILPSNFNIDTFEPDDAHTLDIDGVPLAVGNEELGYFGSNDYSFKVFVETFDNNEHILAVYTNSYSISQDRAVMLCVSPLGKKYIYFGRF